MDHFHGQYFAGLPRYYSNTDRVRSLRFSRVVFFFLSLFSIHAYIRGLHMKKSVGIFLVDIHIRIKYTYNFDFRARLSVMQRFLLFKFSTTKVHYKFSLSGSRGWQRFASKTSQLKGGRKQISYIFRKFSSGSLIN